MTPVEKRSEADRLATGIAPEKWSVMTRAERRRAVAAALRKDARKRRHGQP